MTEWHRWFAWYPVQLENSRWVWLTTIERRLYNSMFYDTWYIYRRAK
jgi:hypothetical protein